MFASKKEGMGIQTLIFVTVFVKSHEKFSCCNFFLWPDSRSAPSLLIPNLNADAELMIFISIHNFFLGPPFCNIGYDICHVGMGVIQTRLAIFRSVGITIMLIVE